MVIKDHHLRKYKKNRPVGRFFVSDLRVRANFFVILFTKCSPHRVSIEGTIPVREGDKKDFLCVALFFQLFHRLFGGKPKEAFAFFSDPAYFAVVFGKSLGAMEFKNELLNILALRPVHMHTRKELNPKIF